MMFAEDIVIRDAAKMPGVNTFSEDARVWSSNQPSSFADKSVISGGEYWGNWVRLKTGRVKEIFFDSVPSQVFELEASGHRLYRNVYGARFTEVPEGDPEKYQLRGRLWHARWNIEVDGLHGLQVYPSPFVDPKKVLRVLQAGGGRSRVGGGVPGLFSYFVERLIHRVPLLFCVTDGQCQKHQSQRAYAQADYGDEPQRPVREYSDDKRPIVDLIGSAMLSCGLWFCGFWSMDSIYEFEAIGALGIAKIFAWFVIFALVYVFALHVAVDLARIGGLL